MQVSDQSLTRLDYEKLLLYLGYARLVLSRPHMKLAPEEARARALLAEAHAELERREQCLTHDGLAGPRTWGPWN